jgi:copper chaperone
MNENANQTILNVPDIVCGGCANSIKNALGQTEGVRAIEVDVENKTVAVAHDETISREKIETILDDIGFPVGG